MKFIRLLLIASGIMTPALIAGAADIATQVDQLSRLTQMPVASSVAGSDLVVVNQGGNLKQAAVSLVGGGGISSLTKNSTTTTSYTNGQLVYSDGTKIQAVGPGTATTLLHGNAAGAPSYGAVNLATDVTGVLPLNVDTACSGTSYTIVLADQGVLVSCANAATQTITIPQATGAFGDGWSSTLQCKGPGNCVLTPTTSTINGSSSVTLVAGQGVTFVSKSGNWEISGTVASTTTAAGANKQIQFNDGGALLGGDADFTWDKTTNSLTITGPASASPTIATFSGLATTSGQTSISFVGTGQTNSLQWGYGDQLRWGGFSFTAPTFVADQYVVVNNNNDVVVGRAGPSNMKIYNLLTPENAFTLTFGAAAGTNITAGQATLVGELSTGNATNPDLVIQTGVKTGSGSTTATATTALTIKGETQNIVANSQFVLKGYAVGSLPTGVEGGMVYVTDASSCPAKGSTFTGGGSAKCPAFYNGTSWISP